MNSKRIFQSLLTSLLWLPVAALAAQANEPLKPGTQPCTCLKGEMQGELKSKEKSLFDPGTIFFCAEQGDLTGLKKLVESQPAGKRKTFVNQWHSVEDNGKQVPTDVGAALHIAASKARLDVVKYLVAQGADVNSRIPNDKRTPLMLVAEGKARDGKTEGAAERTARLEVIGFLIKNGADIKATEHVGWNALDFALSGAQLEAAKLLSTKGLHFRTDSLCNCIWGDDGQFQQIVLWLLNKGANPNVKRNDTAEDTPLHICADKGYPKLARILVEHGAEVAAKNGAGETALQIASQEGASEGQKAVAELLRKTASNAFITLPDTDAELSDSFGAANVSEARGKEDQEGKFDGIVTEVRPNADRSATLLLFSKDGSPTVLAYVLNANRAKFPDLNALKGKRVLIRGRLQVVNGQPKVELVERTQVKIVVTTP